MPHLKDIIPTMADLAKEAVEKIRVVTQPARDIAQWYEQHPQNIFMPSELKHLRRQRYLNFHDLSKIWGQRSSHSIIGRCRRLDIPIEKSKGRNWVSFKNVERAVTNNLPRGFPIIPGTKFAISKRFICCT